MKNKYSNPLIIISRFDTESIVTDSGTAARVEAGLRNGDIQVNGDSISKDANIAIFTF